MYNNLFQVDRAQSGFQFIIAIPELSVCNWLLTIHGMQCMYICM